MYLRIEPLSVLGLCLFFGGTLLCLVGLALGFGLFFRSPALFLCDTLLFHVGLGQLQLKPELAAP